MMAFRLRNKNIRALHESDQCLVCCILITILDLWQPLKQKLPSSYR
jgi:hypothetical protein